MQEWGCCLQLIWALGGREGAQCWDPCSELGSTSGQKEKVCVHLKEEIAEGRYRREGGNAQIVEVMMMVRVKEAMTLMTLHQLCESRITGHKH